MTAEQRSEAANKALATRRKNAVSKRQRKAAHKAWDTMRAAESKMTDNEKAALATKRSRAAKKAWKTIRAKNAA